MKLALPIFICVIFASCFNQGDCLVSATNIMHIQFKTLRNEKVDTSINLTNIFVSGSDSLLGVNAAITEILLPVDIKRDTTQFIFNKISADSVLSADTLTVQYVAQAKVISPACGAFTNYGNLKVVKTSLKPNQIKVFSTSLIKDPTTSGTTAYAVNYQIFY